MSEIVLKPESATGFSPESILATASFLEPIGFEPQGLVDGTGRRPEKMKKLRTPPCD